MHTSSQLPRPLPPRPVPNRKPPTVEFLRKKIEITTGSSNKLQTFSVAKHSNDIKLDSESGITFALRCDSFFIKANSFTKDCLLTFINYIQRNPGQQNSSDYDAIPPEHGGRHAARTIFATLLMLPASPIIAIIGLVGMLSAGLWAFLRNIHSHWNTNPEDKGNKKREIENIINIRLEREDHGWCNIPLAAATIILVEVGQAFYQSREISKAAAQRTLSEKQHLL